MDEDDYNSPSIQKGTLHLLQETCKNASSIQTGWCPTTWDGILCWQSTPPGETSVQPCPHYIVGFDFQANATKHCMGNGQWYWSPERNNTWTNFSHCYHGDLVTILQPMTDLQSDNVTSIEEYLPKIKYISKVGYAVSFSALVVALCILASIKKLRCQRNILHMHLFVSFIARAMMFFLKNLLFVVGVGLSRDVMIKNGESYWLGDQLESNWLCKVFTSVWQYCILANYAWILMEGLYLHNLIFCALFAESNQTIAYYIFLGWGSPAVCVGIWIVLRVFFDDTYCWTTHDNPYIFQVIRIPTTVSVVINFILFVNIVRVLLSKLKSTVSEDTLRYKRLARSTLVLVPLFGVHYTLFLGMSYSMGINETLEIVWLFCDQLFASSQGFFVAVLYCFVNGEVRAELSRAIRSRKWSRSRWSRWTGRSSGRPSTSLAPSNCNCNEAAAAGGKQLHKPNYGSSAASLGPSQRYCCWPSARRHHSMASIQDVGIGTRVGSLASSRDYLEVAGEMGPQSRCRPHGQLLVAALSSASPLCDNQYGQSMMSFCSNLTDVDLHEGCMATSNLTADADKCDQPWSDSEYCQLAHELQHLHMHQAPGHDLRP